MVARQRRDFLRAQAGVVTQDAQQHHGDDAGAARRADHHHAVVGLHEGRGHRAQHALARLRRIGVVTHHPERVGGAGLEREVVHFVVEQHPGARCHQARAEGQVDRLGAGHAVAVGIDDGEVGGLVRLQRRGFAGQQVAGRGPGRIDTRPQPGGVVAAQQGALRDLHEVRITQVEGAVAECTAHGLHHQVGALGLVERLQVPAFEDLQHRRKRDAAG